MCEFCVQHGDGKKWYLAMNNYSRELLAQGHRLEYMTEFANTFETFAPEALRQLELFSATPVLPLARPWLKWHQQRDHFGQVVPLEEVTQILAQMNKVARLPGQSHLNWCPGGLRVG